MNVDLLKNKRILQGIQGRNKECNYLDARGIQRSPSALTQLILPADFHCGRWAAVRAHSCLAGAGYPEAVGNISGEIFGIVAAVSDVSSKSFPLPI